MEAQKRKITLGFTDQVFEAGVHICQIFNDDEERHDALVNYVISGLQGGENTACFSENETPNDLSEFFEKNGLQYEDLEKNGQFSLSKTGEVYFEDGKFDPDRMLGLLRSFYNKSQNENRVGARVIGEMSPDVEHMKDGERLLEYESRVTMLQKEIPVTAVCQYDARVFDGATIMNVLKVHPYMIVKGAIVNNPFYEEPEEYLAKIKK